MKRRISKSTAALLVAALLLLGGSTVTAVRAYPNIMSDYYVAHFYLNHLQVHLLENGSDVCGEANNLDGESKVTGALATSLGYENQNGEKLGSVEPGKLYKEEVAARNGQDIDEFVRLTIRKYWVKADEDGNVLKDESGNVIKDTRLKPSQIHLYYNGRKDGYNTSEWTENENERTTESRTYYLNKILGPGADSPLLVDQIQIDQSVAKMNPEPEVIEDGNKKTFIYKYDYDGTCFFIEADVQAIQTHNANDAIHSQWGTYDVTADSDAGTLTVH